MRMREARVRRTPLASASDLPIGEDKELVLAFKRGEDGSYQNIYDRHFRRVHAICRRMLSNQQDAEEAAQETFLRVFTALGNFNGRYQLGAWIARITTNVCLDQIRAKSRKPTDCLLVDESLELSVRSIANEENPEFLHIKRSEGRRIRKVLDDLAPSHRAAIVLRDFEGFSYADIGIALGMSEGQVKALLHRARTNFKRSWSAQGLAAFMPWNVLARIKRPESRFVDPAPDATLAAGHVAQMAGPISNAAASCSVALQQCGQVFSERLATVMTAVVVGSAAVTTAAASTQPPASPPKEIANVHQSSDGGAVRKGDQLDRRASRKVTSPRAEEAPTPDQAAPPVTEPSPAATPPQKEEAPEPEPEPEPTYAPVAPVLGWETGHAFLKATPTANEVKLDCARDQLDQTLETLIYHQGTGYPAHLVLGIAGGANLDLLVEKDGREFAYEGGAATVTATGSGRDVIWRANGSYSAIGTEQPNEHGLPLYGRFSLQLSIDCIASTLVTEKLSLTVE